MKLSLVTYLNTYIVFLQKTVHTGTPLVATDEFDDVIAKWKEDFDYIFLYSSEVFELPATHMIAGKCDGVVLAVKREKIPYVLCKSDSKYKEERM